MDLASVRRHRWLRRIGASTAVFCLLYLGGWLTGWYGGRLAEPVGDLANLLSAVLGAGLSLSTARRLKGGARRAWLLLGLGMMCWTIAEATYARYDLALHADATFPGPADVAYLLGYLLIGAALLVWPSAPSRSFSRFRWVVDGLLITGSLLIVSWMLVLQSSLTSTDGEVVTLVVGIAYPIGDVLLIALGLSCLSRARLGGQLAVRLLVVAVVLSALADSAYLVAELGAGYVEGTPVGLGWVLCYVLIGMAGLAYDPDVGTDSDVPLRGFGLAAPYLAFAAAMPFIVWQQVHAGQLDAPTVGIAVTCTLGVCLRQWLTSRDNSALTTALAGQQEQLRDLAFHDPLTGLPNRTLLNDRISHGLASRVPQITAVLLLDLDSFKEVNDTYGHAAGDELLVTVSNRLRDCGRPADTVARMGGDEFAIVLAGPPGASIPAAGTAFAVAERICAELSGAYDFAFGEVFVSASIGVALVASPANRGAAGHDADLTSAAELLRNADLAMYRAKHNGGNRAWGYEPELHEAVVRRHALESDLRMAPGRGELAVAYQPVVALPSGRIVGVEALMRWHHPTRGAVPPVEFVAVAEASGQLAELDAWVLTEACRKVVGWRTAGYPLTLAVNTSVRQVQGGGLPGTVTRALAASGLPAAALTLEITENVLLEDTDRAIEVLQELRTLGVLIALDDFGTGYSSLSYLARLPVDRIKIDRSFITELGAEPRLGVLVETVIWMGHRLGLEIVAEGVETRTQASLLEEMDCRLAQGYLYSR
ncbi:MAG: EAL domain-containing protein, partial [Frankiaceae bacterium]